MMTFFKIAVKRPLATDRPFPETGGQADHFVIPETFFLEEYRLNSFTSKEEAISCIQELFDYRDSSGYKAYINNEYTVVELYKS